MNLNRYDALMIRDLIKRLRHPGQHEARARASAVILICRLGYRARVGDEAAQLMEILEEAKHEVETAEA